jgi:hypothetical protein
MAESRLSVQALSSLMLPVTQGVYDMHQRRLLEIGTPSVDLSDPATVSKVLNFAHQSVVQSSDPTVRDSVSPAVNDALIKAASNAIAAVNAQTDKATGAAEMEKTSYLVQTKVYCPQLIPFLRQREYKSSTYVFVIEDIQLLYLSFPLKC